MAPGALSTRRINKDMAHGFGGGSEEMSAPGKSAWLVPGQAQPGLVNQGGGLEGVTWSLPSHFVRGQFPQFLIDQRQQFLGGRLITARHGFENAGNVAHGEDGSRISAVCNAGAYIPQRYVRKVLRGA